jgi:hypothetical protein
VHGVTSQNTGRCENLTRCLLERHRLCPLLSCLFRVGDYDSCGMSPGLMNWFIVLYRMFLLSSPWALQLYGIEMLRLIGRNKRDNIPQDSASWKQSWRRHVDGVTCTGSDFYSLMPEEVEGMLKEDVVTCFKESNYKSGGIWEENRNSHAIRFQGLGWTPDLQTLKCRYDGLILDMIKL